MKRIKYLAALALLPLLATADEVPVDLSFVASRNITNPGVLSGIGTPQPDGDTVFAFTSIGTAKGKPGKAQIQTYLELGVYFTGWVGNGTLAPGCEGANVSFDVMKQEVTLIFNDQSAIYARLAEGVPGYMCFSPEATWFTPNLEILGGSGKYLGATGELEFNKGPDYDPAEQGASGLVIGSGAISGYIITE